jgi:hypothetical protein
MVFGGDGSRAPGGLAPPSFFPQNLPDEAATAGSPLKKQRAGTLDDGSGQPSQPALGVSQPKASTSAPARPAAPVAQSAHEEEEEEEL